MTITFPPPASTPLGFMIPGNAGFLPSKPHPQVTPTPPPGLETIPPPEDEPPRLAAVAGWELVMLESVWLAGIVLHTCTVTTPGVRTMCCVCEKAPNPGPGSAACDDDSDSGIPACNDDDSDGSSDGLEVLGRILRKFVPGLAAGTAAAALVSTSSRLLSDRASLIRSWTLDANLSIAAESILAAAPFASGSPWPSDGEGRVGPAEE